MCISSSVNVPKEVSPIIMAPALVTVAATTVFLLLDRAGAQSLSALAANAALEGKAAYGDWRSDAPGIRRHIRPSDLPVPYASPSRANEVAVVEKPANARLKVPLGFEVKLFANGLDEPRLIRVAPNGDIFVAESVAGRIRVLRPADGGDGVSRNEIFVSGLKLPFGIAFYPRGNDPQWVYVANTDSVVRFPYRNGDLHTNEKAEIIVPTLPAGRRGHWTRDIAFSQDESKMFVSVGSASNAAEPFDVASPRQWMAVLRRWIEQMVYGAASDDETERAVVLVFDPEGKGRRIYASGIRNCVAMAVNSATGDLWCSTNERDGLGDDLPPDYITRVREGGFYGWPWYYIGPHEDPRHKGARPDLKDKVIVPDILIQPHSASMQMMFHTGRQFPAEYKGNIFAAEHGSWNRAKPTGYKIIRIAVKDGVPTGEYEDFVTGFPIDDARVWGRPVGDRDRRHRQRFGLAFGSRDATDTRSELGTRFDRVLAVYSNAVLAFRGRVAWAHDWVSDPTLTPLFQALPGASFIVNGATLPKNSALTSAGAELRLANGVTLLAKFDGEFASHSSTYAGTGTLRYVW